MKSPLGANRDFRFLWIGGLLASTGAQMSWVALPLLVLRHTGSAALAGAAGPEHPGSRLADVIMASRIRHLTDVSV